MRHLTYIYFCFLFTGVSLAPATWGQSTISDQPWEISSSSGPWVALLPAYELGTNANGGSAFRDNLDDVGYISQLKLVRRFLGTRTSFETKGFWANADSINTTDVIDISVPNPSSGAANVLSGNRTHLETKTDHYGYDVALRDTWRTRFGGLSAGAAFSYMAFDQKFDVDYGPNQLLREKLNTDYVGGKAIFGWDGCFRNRPTMIDLGIGFYDMDADYRFLEQSITGTRERELSDTVTTVETSFTTRGRWRGYQIGLTLGAMWISDMPTIEHNTSGPVTLATDEAVTMNGMLEFLL